MPGSAEGKQQERQGRQGEPEPGAGRDQRDLHAGPAAPEYQQDHPQRARAQPETERQAVSPPRRHAGGGKARRRQQSGHRQEQQARRDRRLAEDPLKVQAEHERDAVEGDVGREPDQQARGDGL